MRKPKDQIERRKDRIQGLFIAIKDASILILKEHIEKFPKDTFEETNKYLCDGNHCPKKAAICDEYEYQTGVRPRRIEEYLDNLVNTKRVVMAGHTSKTHVFLGEKYAKEEFKKLKEAQKAEENPK